MNNNEIPTMYNLTPNMTCIKIIIINNRLGIRITWNSWWQWINPWSQGHLVTQSKWQDKTNPNKDLGEKPLLSQKYTGFVS